MISIINGNLCCVECHKTRTAEVTICTISERLPDRPRQLPHASVWGRIAPSEAQGIVVKHRHSRSVTQLCLFAQQSTETPKLLKGHRRRTAGGGGGGGRWVAAQKPPQQHLAGETSLLGATRSPTAVARAPVTSREMATVSWKHQWNQHSRYRGGPRSSLNQGPVHAKVTVIAARQQAPLVVTMLFINTAASVIDVCRSRANTHPCRSRGCCTSRLRTLCVLLSTKRGGTVAKSRHICRPVEANKGRLQAGARAKGPSGAASNDTTSKHGRLNVGIFLLIHWRKLRDHDRRCRVVLKLVLHRHSWHCSF